MATLLLLLKTTHVLGAVLFLGTGLGSAYYKMRAYQSGDARIIAWCDAEIVRADWLFTVPSGVLMPVTGLWLAHLYGMPFTSGWVMWGIAGYVLAGLTWLPAAFLQIKMRTLAERASAAGAPIEADYRGAQRTWMSLGVVSFASAIFTVWVMVTKRSF